MLSTSISDVLFTKTQQKVLGLLHGRPDKTFYLNEIVRIANVGKGTIVRELEKMLAAGIVTVEPMGNQNHYQANKECPVYTELLGIVQKTFGLLDQIKTALKPVGQQIDYAFIYGSIAKGEEAAASDIDLLVITDDLAYVDLMSLLTEAEQALGRTINPSVYTISQIKDKLQQKNAFLTRVMEQPKLWVKGSEDAVGTFR